MDEMSAIELAGPMPKVACVPTKGGSLAATELFRAGKSVDEVAKSLGRARSTTMGYFVDYLEAEQITDPTPWVEPEVVRRIDLTLPLAEDGRLSPIFNQLNGEVSYDKIRIVVACRKNAVSK